MVRQKIPMNVEVLLDKANRDESRICWICRGEFAIPFRDEGDTIFVDCCNCGDYKMSKSLRASRFTLPDSERYRFSFWGKQRQLEKCEPPLLNSYTIEDIVAGWGIRSSGENLPRRTCYLPWKSMADRSTHGEPVRSG